MSRVTISKKAARALAFWEGYGGAITFGPAEQAALAELRHALEPERKPRSSDCQWCGKGILSEPCGPSHRMRQRLALAKTRKQGRR